MTNWYNEVISSPDDYGVILNAYDYYELELEQARKEVGLHGLIERQASMLPGQVEYRFNQLQEVEAILEHLNIKFSRLKNSRFRHYLEHYNKSMSSRDAEKYAENDEEVVILAQIINQIAFIRNKFLGIMKGLENKSFQINNITRLRCSGLEDAELYSPTKKY